MQTTREIIIETIHRDLIRIFIYASTETNDDETMIHRFYELKAFDAMLNDLNNSRYETIESALNALHRFNCEEYANSVYANDDESLSSYR